MERAYYQFAAHRICADCAAQVRAAQAAPSHQAVLRGLLYGTGAGLACSLGYAAIIVITNLEIALVAIAVGWIVGKAVRKGTGGKGGRRVQVLAVALTYFSITFSYVPVGIVQFNRQAAAGRDATAIPANAPERSGGEPVTAARPISGGRIAAVAVAAFGVALVSPLLNLAQGISGLLGIVIISVGLLQAWRLTAGDPRPLSGPFARAGAAVG